jgi:endonuclease/exonuclease/phosphatase (EEP) superfamily protein YafD
MSRKKRDEQIDYLINEVGDDGQQVIIGGDFNTLTQASVQNLENFFAGTNIVRTSKGAGYSVDFLGLKFPMDHIFSKNYRVLNNGILKDSLASDHFPVWAILEIDD